ncbi:organic cation transporter protein-like, partial [Oppia nitens]|uniref:organic cation transporter protein-like n=1 Tax=Oppia nitens TaxID=1686743 RepID=UPI0023D9FA96
MSESAKDKSSVKHIADIVGEWGKWQFHFVAYCFILWSFAAINNMGYSFHAYNNDFWCSDVPIDYLNKTEDMKCFKFLSPNESCTEWQYDRTQFGNSIITEFDLVCSRSNFASISQTLFMLGYVVSGLVFAHYSDKYGRRPIVWLSFSIEIFGILLCALSTNIYFYSFARFLVGMGSSGRGMTIYIIMLECIGSKYRSDVSLLGGVGWLLGYASIPGLAYWLQDYKYLQLISLVPLSTMFIWFYWFYESPRWQITVGQLDKAEVTLKNALKLNGKSDVNLKQKIKKIKIKTQTEGESQRNYTALDLVKTPLLRKISFILWYTWIVEALLYYGFSLNIGDFGGNFYITFLLSGLVELPSQILCVFLLRVMGRRTLFSLFLFMTSASCFAIIPSQSDWLKVTFALMAKFGVNSAWNVMAIHGPELYPTVLRQRGQGMASVFSRIGSISSPFMRNLAANTSLAVVMILYGLLSLVSALLVLLLPETKGREIPDTIEEAENVL